MKIFFLSFRITNGLKTLKRRTLILQDGCVKPWILHHLRPKETRHHFQINLCKGFLSCRGSFFNLIDVMEGQITRDIYFAVHCGLVPEKNNFSLCIYYNIFLIYLTFFHYVSMSHLKKIYINI